VRDTMPFLMGMFVALAIITFIPSVVLFVPRLFGYSG
jgi:C4-dicarboxylate transporter, DctM subunit